MNRKRWIIVLLGLIIWGMGLGGCQSIRGVMYLHPPRVGDYLAKSSNSLTATTDSEKHREWMRQVPDGNRILGGFCTDKVVMSSLIKLRKLALPCNRRTNRYAAQAGLQGSLFWGFLISTVATGTGMIITGIAIQDPEAKGWTAFTFGAVTFTLAMINGLGGFDGRQTVLNMNAKKLDNFMWTMRLRVIAEVCNGKNLLAARQQMSQIVRDTRNLCVTQQMDDGTYEIPERSKAN